MKKHLITFIVGAVLAGAGTGIFCMELTGWAVSDNRQDLAGLPADTYSAEENIDLENGRALDIHIGRSGRSSGAEVEIVEDDRYTDTVAIEVTYCGEEPYCYTYDFYNDEYSGAYYSFYITTDYYRSLYDYKDIIKDMFSKKVFYSDFNNCLIKKVIVRTAWPDKVNIF